MSGVPNSVHQGAPATGATGWRKMAASGEGTRNIGIRSKRRCRPLGSWTPRRGLLRGFGLGGAALPGVRAGNAFDRSPFDHNTFQSESSQAPAQRGQRSLVILRGGFEPRISPPLAVPQPLALAPHLARLRPVCSGLPDGSYASRIAAPGAAMCLPTREQGLQPCCCRNKRRAGFHKSTIQQYASCGGPPRAGMRAILALSGSAASAGRNRSDSDLRSVR